MSDRETLDAYDRLAEDYAKAFPTDAPGALLKAFIDAVPAAGSVLDYGCGPGFDAVLMQRAGLSVCAFDGSQSMVDMAREKIGPFVERALFDEMTARLETAPATLDGVWANFSLLHAPREDLPKHIHAIAHALRPGGVFHIALKTGTGLRRDRLSRLYTFLGEDELQHLVEKTGLMVIDKTTGRDKGLAGDVSPWIALLARKPLA